MLNATARLAVSIENLPDWDFDWNDCTPQCSRESLTIGDFLPSVDDAMAIKQAAILYIMEFLVQNFPSLRELKQYVPSRYSSNLATKPAVAAMKILFKDEKYKAETIEIIRQLITDGNLSGNPQVQNIMITNN